MQRVDAHIAGGATACREELARIGGVAAPGRYTPMAVSAGKVDWADRALVKERARVAHLRKQHDTGRADYRQPTLSCLVADRLRVADIRGHKLLRVHMLAGVERG